MAYTEMKSLTNKVKGVNVYYASPKHSEFRKYSIEVEKHGDPIFIYQEAKPTIKELHDYLNRA